MRPLILSNRTCAIITIVTWIAWFGLSIVFHLGDF